jgi:putative DNA methylase
MIPKECKRLAEVDFPLAVVSNHAAREKSIRHGHPSTLYLWWARRPLAACRAILLGLLLPDPCDPYCPAEFKEGARDALQELLGVREGDKGLRRALITFIGDVANWDVANHPRWIGVARELVRAAHGDEPPLVVDPFAGGGSIPLEALRLGCDTFASDLNPVACLILKVLLEEIPRRGRELTAELRRVGTEVKKAAEKELGKFYPIDPDGAKPIAYLWARTVQCEAPNCGAEIPLLRSFWLCKKASRKYALRYRIVREKGKLPYVDFELFEPRADREVQAGTVVGAKATCLCCNMVLPADRVRAQLYEQRSGADVFFAENGKRIGGAQLLAVVTLIPGEQGRQYRLPMERDYEVVREALRALAEASAEELLNGLSSVPDEPIIQAKVAKNSPFRFHLYGCDSFGQVSNARQKLLITTVAKHVRTRHNGNSPVQRCLSILVDRLANANPSLCRWDNTRESLQGMYSGQAISMVWDFCEGSPFAEAAGGFDGALEWILNVVEGLAVANLAIGQVQQVDAIESPLADSSTNVWFTDPPYYDAVSYADLSDFFFAWLKRTHHDWLLLRDPYDANDLLTPKDREIIQDDAKQINGRPKDRTFFEEMMARAFAEGRRVL